MTQISMPVLYVPTTAEPRGSVWVGKLYDWIARRAQRGSAPTAELTLARTRAREAAAVREMARSFENSEPSFAADLYAAALRHESHEEPAPTR